MYGKIFDSMYEGTLYGHWKAIVTFQQMIVLADADGVIDMTPQAIAARTSIPLEIIQEGLVVLEAPDPYSRTPGQDGKRVELLDEHRPWGWHIVNHEKYKYLKDAEEVREENRIRQREKRLRDAKLKEDVTASHEPSQAVTTCHEPSQTVTSRHEKSRYTDTDTDTDTDTKTTSLPSLPSKGGSVDKSQRRRSRAKGARQEEAKVNGGAWWESESATLQRAAEVGVVSRAGESWEQLRARIRVAIRDDKADGGS